MELDGADADVDAYASTSTRIPEQSPQISFVPINSRAQVIGSRLKKEARTILFAICLGDPFDL